MAYIGIYKVDDDSLVSEADAFVNPISFSLRADLEEADSVRLYAMADDGYAITEAVVSLVGTSAAKWSLAPDVTGAEGTYEAPGDPITLGAVGTGAGKVYFWAKAEATDDESPTNDTSVTLSIAGVAEVV